MFWFWDVFVICGLAVGFLSLPYFEIYVFLCFMCNILSPPYNLGNTKKSSFRLTCETFYFSH